MEPPRRGLIDLRKGHPHPSHLPHAAMAAACRKAASRLEAGVTALGAFPLSYSSSLGSPGFRRRLAAFLGPGYLVAVGYMDPGNWATSLAGGSAYGYTLLSVALLSNIMFFPCREMTRKSMKRQHSDQRMCVWLLSATNSLSLKFVSQGGK